jgi:uncharacterized RDD family membrane protein YckC
MQNVLSIPSVTGVDLNLRIAGPGARSYAFIIDWHIRVLAALAWFAAGTWLLVGGLVPGPASTNFNFEFMVELPALAIYFLYHPIVELIMAGRTPGKRIAGVRVVRTDGGIPSVGAILIRNIFRLIDCLPVGYCVGLTVAIFSERSLRIGDYAAGTVLVYDEPKRESLADFSSEALGRIGIEQMELVRELLDRWDALKPDVRGSLARKLLAKLDAMPHDDMDAELRRALESLLIASPDEEAGAG